MNEERIGRVEIALLHIAPLMPLINTEARHRTRDEGGIRQQEESDSVHCHQHYCLETQWVCKRCIKSLLCKLNTHRVEMFYNNTPAFPSTQRRMQVHIQHTHKDMRPHIERRTPLERKDRFIRRATEKRGMSEKQLKRKLLHGPTCFTSDSPLAHSLYPGMLVFPGERRPIREMPPQFISTDFSIHS